ncbi:bifunctional 2-polyprenyl-6-hydroxyphenol methylase/3-demethylubiquinol 3-O-methyltransferase UbiG [Leptothoe sp. PORK10 BA2]|uniref:bifunctional 2-polyprenyl-6-hydroxyphenol methylase/3-demethylubiquinol 3-O-methyltransferase UbiG n=1 Tax=Leptothoe sp. PORK10 BA2 TaxID=3110254 RepID=UPI002B1F0A7A|nr:bifunctional 2-polyprenyl-6-hydroxyphenol methylase/3-demethylubiquinol 3-O-methyltransferase UbiG [Leptothoe sp. PORK10 BA2]MEA5466596.1 bifunctional 2-polyprenyl-6-hydroxyphenol methylase/3-demethylubiquinol 3-O-methyltransferase UbiG [Leptothoe sp. PORK10 BA2]
MERNNLAFYDQQAAQWWSETATIFPLSKMNPLRFEYFDRAIPEWDGLRVLDVGCGGGYTCEFLAQRGAVVTGIDQSAACIQVAKDHGAAMGLTIDYRVGVGENLPFGDDGFDVVVCVDVLEHVESPAATVMEIGRVLRPGGLFCFDTINRTLRSHWIMIWLLEDVLRQIPRGVHDWQKFVRPEELEELLQQAGFSEVTMQGFDLFGRQPWAQMTNLMHFWQTGGFRVRFDQDTRVMYIGTAQWG